MKEEQIKKLIRISDEIAQKMFEQYPAMVERELEGVDSVVGVELLQALKEEESAKLKSAGIPSYAKNTTDLERGLLVDPSLENIDVVFKPWYQSFRKVEKDSEYMHGIIRFEPQLIEDGTFIHERDLYEFDNNPDYGGNRLEDTSFFWNVHILVLVYQYLTLKRISCLRDRLQEFVDVGSGLNCDLSPEQKRTMFSKLVEGKFIHERTTERNFIAAMTPDPLPNGFQKVKWILSGKEGNPHKTALREFLDMYCKPTQGRETNVPHQDDINRIFCDAGGSPIILAKPTKSKPSNYYTVLENLIQ